ncbi:MAG: radical SAM protein [Bacteroidaceae bacterium]|nr:radical SAM protein [Bacteroidaceae bacterium]
MARIFAISRHRIGTDGMGVTTLVAMLGCPLDCRYCLNKQCKAPASKTPEYSAAGLLEEVMIDDLYFQATGGGITFGGGEPLLYPDFIAEFKSLCPAEWKMNIETSLAVPQQNVEKIVPLADCMIIDTKDLDNSIYTAYTGKDNGLLMSNLEWIIEAGLQDKCLLRLPLIKGYNSPRCVSRSRIKLAAMGFRHFDEFNYIISKDEANTDDNRDNAADVRLMGIPELS